jgi:sulfate transport system ATP-binding protein
MSIVLDRLLKHYDGHRVVNSVSLEVADGEFFVLLGPSGSGKSTVLRMIAGLTSVDAGSVHLHGKDVTDLPPQGRGVGFVFQHYALFRHMTVAANIEFALRIRRAPARERRARRDELLELVGLAGLGGRMPSQLSGGQQQRVALARALAHKPDVLLLDEPFGALDARIRAELRQTIRTIQRELNVTTIFVTHDQEEAFELADRLGIMNFGRLLEIGPPQELYLRPQTEFVASFLGTANLMVGEVGQDGIKLGPNRFPLGTAIEPVAERPRRVLILFRPEDVAVKDSQDALEWPLLGKAVVEESHFSGSFERLRLRLPPIPGVRTISPTPPFGEDSIIVEASRSQHQTRRYPLHSGAAAWVGIRRLHALMHPGLRILLFADGTAESGAAISLCGHVARMAHARVTLLASEATDGSRPVRQTSPHQAIQKAKESIGSGPLSVDSWVSPEPPEQAVATEAARESYDLIVHALPASGRVELAERLLEDCDAHLLLVPSAPVPPSRVLICVAVGEPAKEGVRFAGRLVRHLGAEATILTVTSSEPASLEIEQAERFLLAGAKTLSVLGVSARTTVRNGEIVAEVLKEADDGRYDWLVLGTPLADDSGRIDLGGLAATVLNGSANRPVLLVRSRDSTPRRVSP